MSQNKHFLYEHRTKGIPKFDWRNIREAVDKLQALVMPMSGSPGSFAQIAAGSDENCLYLTLGGEERVIRRIWPKKEYDAPKLPGTISIDGLSDLFIRSVYLAVAFYAPAGTRLELRSTGCLDGWKEARDLFGHATGNVLDIDRMVANERLCKGFDSPLPETGDSHLIGLATKIIGLPTATDMGDPEWAGTSSGLATVRDIPFVSHSWFF